MRCPSPCRRAFTLVELLVVITIISVLVSILLPALSGAREAARRVSCSSKLRTWGFVALNYTSDYHGWLPQSYCAYNGTISAGCPSNLVTDATQNPLRGTSWTTYQNYGLIPQSLLCPSADYDDRWMASLPVMGNYRGSHVVDVGAANTPTWGLFRTMQYGYVANIQRCNSSVLRASAPVPSQKLNDDSASTRLIAMDLVYWEGAVYSPNVYMINHTRTGKTPEYMNSVAGDGHVITNSIANAPTLTTTNQSFLHQLTYLFYYWTY